MSEEMWILFACNGDNINFNMTFGHGEYPFAGRVWQSHRRPAIKYSRDL